MGEGGGGVMVPLRGNPNGSAGNEVRGRSRRRKGNGRVALLTFDLFILHSDDSRAITKRMERSRWWYDGQLPPPPLAHRMRKGSTPCGWVD